MLDILNPLRELSIVSIIFRFLLATGCGAVIGYERSKKRHAAGLRTHIVVCIGASSVMLLNQYLSFYFNSNADPARLGAQVISGIGFLGAGTIVITGYQRGQRVKGLTTAAGLWASACMGLTVGSGFYEAAVIMCGFLFCVIATLNRLDEKYLKDSTVIRFYIEYTVETPFSTILATIRKNRWHLSHLEYPGGHSCPINSAIIDVQRFGQDSDRNVLLSTLRNTNGVLFVEDA
ncbi:MAG: MgtC/SapB family protein [Oscillospiraceae bacterium]|jgi:putative Mg2+ transporter-C (MgtC) family protein|nr:MgtC/SapB family protein [Oscillospiraceae bacterium]